MARRRDVLIAAVTTTATIIAACIVLAAIILLAIVLTKSATDGKASQTASYTNIDRSTASVSHYTPPPMGDIDTITRFDAELRLVAALRLAARERVGRCPD